MLPAFPRTSRESETGRRWPALGSGTGICQWDSAGVREEQARIDQGQGEEGVGVEILQEKSPA